MAGSSLLLLLDDITAVLDDVATMTKVATQKTAGVLGDDLALNAQQLTGVSPQREIPVIWAVAKGSLLNKLILVPSALAISYFIPVAVMPLLAVGGLFLCFEGFEKLVHKFLHPHKETKENHEQHLKALSDPAVDLVAFEKDKIKGAVRTDFILSAEIIVISLVTVADKPFNMQLTVLSVISILMTAFIYGLVACIVKIDDLGLFLTKNSNTEGAGKLKPMLGRGLLKLSPFLMRFLSILGTIAMFLVGGGIIAHAIPYLAHLSHDLDHYLKTVEGPFAWLIGLLAPALMNGVIGLLAGAAAVVVFELIKKLRRK